MSFRITTCPLGPITFAMSYLLSRVSLMLPGKTALVISHSFARIAPVPRQKVGELVPSPRATTQPLFQYRRAPGDRPAPDAAAEGPGETGLVDILADGGLLLPGVKNDDVEAESRAGCRMGSRLAVRRERSKGDPRLHDVAGRRATGGQLDSGIDLVDGAGIGIRVAGRADVAGRVGGEDA